MVVTLNGAVVRISPDTIDVFLQDIDPSKKLHWHDPADFGYLHPDRQRAKKVLGTNGMHALESEQRRLRRYYRPETTIAGFITVKPANWRRLRFRSKCTLYSLKVSPPHTE
ncbi:MAG: hypothetical protein JWM37_646 [Candidatus Saccharibacteria bacterium]|nr:hypothetical protein [Candidatus Saccharibacteria bacterium]